MPSKTLDWGAHVCRFYDSPQDLLEILVPYFREGLEQGEFCVWIVSEPLSVDEARRALTAAVPDLARYEAEGQMEFLRFRDAYFDGSGRFRGRDALLRAWREKEKAVLAKGFAGLRATGDPYVRADEWAPFMDYEGGVHKAFEGTRMKAVCTYRLTQCGSKHIADVLASHYGDAVGEGFVPVARENEPGTVLMTKTLDILGLQELKLQATIQASPLPIVLIDPDTTVRLWNAAAERVFGWSEAEVLGRPIPIVPEEKLGECRSAREAMGEGKAFAGVETYRLRRDGARIDVRISAAPVRTEGRLRWMVLIFEDITAQKRAQRELELSYKELEQFA